MKKSKIKTKPRFRVKVLMVMQYKGTNVYIRQIGRSIFMWDMAYDGEIYSGHFVITPGKKRYLNKSEIDEVTKMCYAGAAATIDYKRGDKLSKTDADTVKRFESARASVEGTVKSKVKAKA